MISLSRRTARPTTGASRCAAAPRRGAAARTAARSESTGTESALLGAPALALDPFRQIGRQRAIFCPLGTE